MSLSTLFHQLAEACSGPEPIEQRARDALRDAAGETHCTVPPAPLAPGLVDVMTRHDAHPACRTLLALDLPWAPPTTSSDPTYIAHSQTKAHVELIGPGGLVPSKSLRIGVYGIDTHSEYGLRTHLAEEIFIMLAGAADWKRDTAPYRTLTPGERTYHPSMLPHATRTRDQAFMSLYVWNGDISTDSYAYAGLPTAPKGAG